MKRPQQKLPYHTHTHTHARARASSISKGP